MKLRGGVEASGVDQLNMTPMIDCIFQLLIFFMCATHFKSLEAKMAALLPRDVGSGPDDVRRLPREVRVTLEFDPGTSATRFLVAGREVPAARVGEEAYAQFLRLRAATPAGPRVPVKIDAAPDVPFQDVVFVMDECRRRDMPDVEYAASRPPGR